MRFIHLFAVVVTMALALVASPTSARAGLQIWVSDMSDFGGNSITTTDTSLDSTTEDTPTFHMDTFKFYIASGNSLSVAHDTNPSSPTYGSKFFDVFVKNLSGISNSPGGSTATLGDNTGEVLNSNVEATSPGDVARKFYIRIGDVEFTSPTAPPDIFFYSHIDTEVKAAGPWTDSGVPPVDQESKMRFQSWVDQANSQNTIGEDVKDGDTVPADIKPGFFTPGTQFPTVDHPVSPPVFHDEKITTISSLASPYSITQDYQITVVGKGNFSWNGKTTLTSAPEPGTMVLWGLGMVGMGIATARRRKQLPRAAP